MHPDEYPGKRYLSQYPALQSQLPGSSSSISTEAAAPGGRPVGSCLSRTIAGAMQYLKREGEQAEGPGTAPGLGPCKETGMLSPEFRWRIRVNSGVAS
jgi:hypothetical protein